MPVAARVGHAVLAAAVGALALMVTERRGVTGGAGAEDFAQGEGLGRAGCRGAGDGVGPRGG